MGNSIFLNALDLAFRFAASSFTVEKALDESAQFNKERFLNQELNKTLLVKFGQDRIVAALRDFSFQETLLLIKVLEKESRTFILDSLQDHHDLKAALEFGMNYESGSESTELQDSQKDVIPKFLDRLSEANKKICEGKGTKDNGSLRLIDMFNSKEMAQVAGISAEFASAVVKHRDSSSFKDIQDLASRMPNIPAPEVDKLSRYF